MNMSGPFNLTVDEIDEKVYRTSPGGYLLGDLSPDGSLQVRYVGRSDTDLNRRLKDWAKRNEYGGFGFTYARSCLEAYVMECNNYHDYGGKEKLDNDIHPAHPNAAFPRCPRCGA